MNIRILLAATALAALTTSIWADVQIYTDPAPFLFDAGQITLESFEVEFPRAPSVNFDSFTATEVSTTPMLISRTDHVTHGERSIAFNWNGDGYFELAFERPVWALGVNILDFGTCCGPTEFHIVDDGGQFDALAAVGSDLPRGNVQFFGVVTDDPFSTVRFFSSQASDNDLVLFDELRFTATPEPGSGGCLVIGFVLLSLIRHRVART